MTTDKDGDKIALLDNEDLYHVLPGTEPGKLPHLYACPIRNSPSGSLRINLSSVENLASESDLSCCELFHLVVVIFLLLSVLILMPAIIVQLNR